MLNQNTRVILTGATSGIGRSLAYHLSSIGVKLALCGRNEEKMNSLLANPEVSQQTLYHDCFCMTSEQNITNFVNKACEKLSGVDILINCAGSNTSRGALSEIQAADMDYVYAVNLRAPFIFMREAFEQMKPHKTGTILNVHSTVCLYHNEGIGAYTAVKAGFDALSKVFRKEAAHEGVHLLGVYPGGVDTGFRSKSRPDYMTPDGVAAAITAQLSLPENVIPHELVIRPSVETNY